MLDTGSNPVVCLDSNSVLGTQSTDDGENTTYSNIPYVIEWLMGQGLSPLPVAPAQDPYHYPKIENSEDGGKCCKLKNGKPIPLFTGKNPSYLDGSGKPWLISHRTYQDKQPTPSELKQWWQNPLNGIGCLGANWLVWLDIDAKNFTSQSECDRQFNDLINAHPELKNAPIQKTHSGGYRIGVKVEKPLGFTNFSLQKDGQHIGECLGKGRFAVLAPTIGPSGNPYQALNDSDSFPLVDLSKFIYHYQARTTEKKIKPIPDRIVTLPNKERLSDVEIAIQCIKHIPLSDFDDYQSWLEVGMALHSVDESLLSVWDDWSKNSEKYEPFACEDKWKSFTRTGGRQIGSLINWAKQYGYKPPKISTAKGISKNQTPDFDDDLIPQNKWSGLIEHNYQMGVINHKAETPFLVEGEDDKNEQILLEKPNLIKFNKKIEKSIPDPDTGEIIKIEGYETKLFNPLADFIFSIEKILESKENEGGYLLRIERNVDGKIVTSRVQVDGKCCHRVQDFMGAINASLGLHLVCNAKHQDLLSTLQIKKKACYAKKTKIARLAPRIGCQDDGTWVFENIQFTRDGKITDENKSNWIFNHRLSNGDEHIPSPIIAEPNPKSLHNLISALRVFAGENFVRCLAVIGYGAAALHYQEIIKQEGAFPILNLFGEPGGFKSIASESASSLFGINWASDGSLSSSSESALYERLKSTGNLLTIYDDPMRNGGNLDELLKRLYNGKPRVVRGNTQTPYSPVCVTTNHVCGDDSAATRSRLIRLFFPIVEISQESKSAWPMLREAQKQASGALPDLIAIGYPKAEIDAIERELILHLNQAHIRIAKSLAILVCYAQKVCNMAGVDIDFKQWAIANLCPSENDDDAHKDSLQDFLEKVSILQSKAVLGEWNVRVVQDRNGQDFTALVLSEVWAAVDREFKPPYSQSIIKALITQAGGALHQSQKFYPNQDVTNAYERNRLMCSDANPPDKKTKKCCLIPIELPRVTTSYHQVTKNGNSRNPYYEGVSASFSSQVTKVTINKEEEEKKSQQQAETYPYDQDFFENDPIGDFSENDGNFGNFGNSGNVTITGQGLQELPSVVTEGNQVVTDGNSPPETEAELLEAITVERKRLKLNSHQAQNRAYKLLKDNGGLRYFEPGAFTLTELQIILDDFKRAIA